MEFVLFNTINLKGLMKMNHNYKQYVIAPPPVRPYSDRVSKFEEGVKKDTLLYKESVF